MAVGILLLTPSGFAVWQLVKPLDAAWAGRTAGQWISELSHRDVHRRQIAVAAFAAMGKPALPALVRVLEDRDSPVEEFLMWLGRRLPPAAGWAQPAADRHRAALEALEKMEREDAIGALPALIGLLDSGSRNGTTDEQCRAKAAEILGGLGKEGVSAVPVLLGVIRADGGRGTVLGRAALAAVNGIGMPRASMGPVLVDCLRSGDEQMRRLAASGLGNWGAEGAFAVGSLRRALWNPDAEVFAEVAHALGSAGPAARAAAPDLIRGLSHARPIVRASAAMNLARVRADPGLALAPLVDLLRDEDGYVRSRAAWALGQYGADARGAVGDLAEALHDSSETVQIAVIEALGSIGPGAIGAVDDLKRARSNRQAGLGRFVLAALERIEGSSLVP